MGANMARKREISRPDPQSLTLARDLVASGLSWADASRRTNIPASTIRTYAKRQNWLVPKKVARLYPPPTLPPSVQREASGVPEAAAPPIPAPTGDVIQYGKDLFFHALKIVGLKPMTEADAWRIIREVPPALRALCAVPDKPLETSDPVEVIMARIGKLSELLRPEIDAHSAGEIDEPA